MFSQDPGDQKTLLLAILLSVGVMLAWQFFYASPKIKEEQEEMKVEEDVTPMKEEEAPTNEEVKDVVMEESPPLPEKDLDEASIKEPEAPANNGEPPKENGSSSSAPAEEPLSVQTGADLPASSSKPAPPASPSASSTASGGSSVSEKRTSGRTRRSVLKKEDGTATK